jgi:lysophospholipase L1-like esterase
MKKGQYKSRRNFIKQISALGTVASLPQWIQAMPAAIDDINDVKESHTILFQGDSITDGNRTRSNDWNHVMGHGYQFIIASKLWYDLPNKGLHFFNRGISGNNVRDLTARWKDDTLALKPDVLSILIGINDTERFFRGDQNFSVEQYEKNYDELLQKTRDELPKVQLVLGEPFILPVGRVKENLPTYEKELKMRREVVKKLASKYKAIFIPFQTAFNNALKKAPADYWIWDGIHPMPAGHELMAREWLKHVQPKFSFLR